MNKVETVLVNSFPQGALQRWYEAPLLVRLGGRIWSGRALEIGCGSGHGSRLILDRFCAATLDAVDLDRRAGAAAEQWRTRIGADCRLGVAERRQSTASQRPPMNAARPAPQPLRADPDVPGTPAAARRAR